MIYSAWTKIDSGREGLWENKVWLGTLQIISRHEGEDFYEISSPVYAELEDKLPGQGWMMKDEHGSPRPLFRDYPKPWTATGLLDLTDKKLQLTISGRQVATGVTSPVNFFKGFIKKWVEDDQRPFSELAAAFIGFNASLNLHDLYFGVMLGFRRGDNIAQCITAARTNKTLLDETPRRRLLILLSILESAGAIAKEDSKKKDADARWMVWDKGLLQEVAIIGTAGTPAATTASLLNIKEITKSFSGAISSRGLAYENNLLYRFSSALLTKRFGLLTGLAGSGKTKLAEAFAMWLTESEDQYRVVAVGADWTSNETLLGYADALNAGAYQLPSNGVLDLIIKASNDKEKPYFLILDEMNLSHVERYFADFLSAMESSNSKLRLHGAAAGLMANTITVPHELALPNNLFIIGTVNVDETTYMFSPKVLDRANVIEFRATRDQMAAFLDDPTGINLQALAAQGAAFAQGFVQRSNADADIKTLVNDAGAELGPQLKADLLVLFTALADMGAEFGFRTAKEIARFIVIHKELSGTSWQYKVALDAQVLQKMMPKLHGSARKLDGVLKELDAFASAKDLPLTLEKVKRMQDRLKRDGFTSFAEA